MQIPHHPYEALWIAEHTGPRHRVTLTPHANEPDEIRDGVQYARYLLRCACSFDAVTVTRLEPAVYARYVRARDEGLTVPTLPAKTDMRWDLDPYTTARRLTANRARRLTLDDHPWPTHAPAVQAIEHWYRRTTVKVEFICTCGFHDGLTIETPSGRLTLDDYPLPAPVIAAETADTPELQADAPPIADAPVVVPDTRPTEPPPALDGRHIDLRAVRALLTVPVDALQRARLALSAAPPTTHTTRRRARRIAGPFGCSCR